MSKTKLNDLVRQMRTNGQTAGTRAIGARIAVKDVRDRWDLDDASKARGVDLEWRKVSEHALSLQAKHRALRAEFDKTVRDMTSPHKLSGGPEAEMLRQAAWRRLERVLDAAPARAVKFAIAQKELERAAADGDVHMIDVSRRELSSYLAAHGEKLPNEMAAWLDFNGSSEEAAVARLIADSAAETINRSSLAVDHYAGGAVKREMPAVIVGMEPGQVIYTDPDHDPSIR